jgi:hypothetical protein
MSRSILSAALFLAPALVAQQSDFQQILDRLERIEHENKRLAEEVRALRTELAASRTIAPPAAVSPPTTVETPPPPPPPPPLAERVDVNEQRIAEQAQTKVEASQKLPIAVTGMLLFNAFLNGRANGGAEYPVLAAQGDSSSTGATLGQSVFGLKFQGPQVLGGGQISGAAYVDAWGGMPSSSLDHLFRLRTATVQIDWKNTTIVAGQDKPIISPREPNSLAQVAVPPLVRVEQRFAFGQQAGLTADAGVYETSEPSYAARSGEGGGPYGPLSTPRPAIEGRFNFWRKFGDGARIEIAPGFHESTTHAGGYSIPSRLATVDWLLQPVSKLQFTGMFYTGENAAGLGALPQGFSISYDARAVSIGANGGWMQLSYLATKRLTFNLFAGEENDRLADLLSGDIHTNQMYGVNAIYRLGSNVLLGAEVSQVRTNYFLLPSRLNNHYDLSLGYLF